MSVLAWAVVSFLKLMWGFACGPQCMPRLAHQELGAGRGGVRGGGQAVPGEESEVPRAPCSQGLAPWKLPVPLPLSWVLELKRKGSMGWAEGILTTSK